MKFKAFAKKMDMNEDELIEVLIENGYLKKNGDPKSKYIDDLFDEDGNVISSKKLQEIVSEIVDGEDEDDAEENEDVDLGGIEERLDSIEKQLEKLEEAIASNAELLEELKELLNRDVDDDEDDEDEDDDSDSEDEDEDEEDEDIDDDDEDEDEDEEDPNAEGKYRGWTITRKGISVFAKKGKNEIRTSVKGNIREKIDEVED